MVESYKLTELQECLINLQLIFSELYFDYQDAKNIQSDNSFLKVSLTKYWYIRICSFLEEYEILNRLAKNNEDLKDTLYVCAPIVRNLEKYKGLRKMKNLMLAHFNRDKQQKFKPWWEELKGFRKPLREDDIKELYESIAFIKDLLFLRHKNEWEQTIHYLKISVKLFIKEDIDFQNKMKQVEKSMSDINKEVLKRMKEKNIKPLNEIEKERGY